MPAVVMSDIDLLRGIASFGAFPAVPAVGLYVLSATGVLPILRRVSVLGQIAVVCCLGLLILTPVLLGSAILGWYRPAIVGLLGWAVCLSAAVFVFRRRGVISGLRRRWRRLSWTDGVLALGLGAAAVVYLGWPADTSLMGRDMSVYSNHAIHIARSGRIDLPLPWPPGAGAFFQDALVSPSGFFPGENAVTVQFGHVYPAWLAQVFSAFGTTGLYRTNTAFVLLGLFAIHGVVAHFAGRGLAAAATLFLAFNASFIWMAHISLTEPFTQAVIWSGLLLALPTGASRAPAAVAGALFGFAFLIRIDSLFLLPLILTAHALGRVLGIRGAGWRHFYAALIVTTAVGIAYYAIFSWPYLEAHSGPLLQIAGAAAVATIVLAVTAYEPVRARISRVASTWFAAAAVIAGISAALAWAAFGRPYIEPFDIIASDLDFVSRRSYVEQSVVNLASYLSGAVVLGATVGASMVIWRLAVYRMGFRALLPLTVITGYSALYFWNQAIVPDHFWAIRRFVPVVIPGFVLFAVIAVAGIHRGYSLRTPLIVVLAGFAAGHTVSISLPTAFVAEDRGSYGLLGTAVRAIPSDEPVLAFELSPNTVRPLWAAYDVNIVPLDLMTDEGRDAALQWIRDRATRGREAYVYASTPELVTTLRSELLSSVSIQGTRVQPTYRPVPRDTYVSQTDIHAFSVTGTAHLGVPLGGQRWWTVAESGFSVQEEVDGTPVRWTTGVATLEIPLMADERVTALHIRLADTGPSGSRLRIVVDGATVFAGQVEPGAWARTLDVDVPQEQRSLTVKLISDVFLPAETIPDSTDDRVLGVMLSELTLVDSRGAESSTASGR